MSEKHIFLKFLCYCLQGNTFLRGNVTWRLSESKQAKKIFWNSNLLNPKGVCSPFTVEVPGWAGLLNIVSAALHFYGYNFPSHFYPLKTK